MMLWYLGCRYVINFEDTERIITLLRIAIYTVKLLPIVGCWTRERERET